MSRSNRRTTNILPNSSWKSDKEEWPKHTKRRFCKRSNKLQMVRYRIQKTKVRKPSSASILFLVPITSQWICVSSTYQPSIKKHQQWTFYMPPAWRASRIPQTTREIQSKNAWRRLSYKRWLILIVIYPEEQNSFMKFKIRWLCKVLQESMLWCTMIKMLHEEYGATFSPLHFYRIFQLIF